MFSLFSAIKAIQSQINRIESLFFNFQPLLKNENFEKYKSKISGDLEKAQNLISEKTKLTDKIKKLKNELEGVDDKSPKFIETNAKLGELERNLEKVEDEMDDVNQKLRQMELEYKQYKSK